MITAHEGDPTAYVWRLQNFTIGEHRLRPPPSAKKMAREQGGGGDAFAPLLRGGRRARVAEEEPLPDAPVTSVAISSCGNFGIVGTAAGRVDRYNMQSGLHRGMYCRIRTASGPLTPAHDGAVVGIGVDSCNHFMVTGGVDKLLRIWDFKVGESVRKV